MFTIGGRKITSALAKSGLPFLFLSPNITPSGFTNFTRRLKGRTSAYGAMHSNQTLVDESALRSITTTAQLILLSHSALRIQGAGSEYGGLHQQRRLYQLCARPLSSMVQYFASLWF